MITITNANILWLDTEKLWLSVVKQDDSEENKWEN